MNSTTERLIESIGYLNPMARKNLELLIDYATKDPDWNIRLAALSVLSKDLCPETLIEIAEKDEEPRIRLKAIRMLEPGTHPGLMWKISQEDSDPFVRLAAKAMASMEEIYTRDVIQPKQICKPAVKG